MPSAFPNLFHGKLVRFVAPHPDDATFFTRWDEDGEYRRMLDTEYAHTTTQQENLDFPKQFVSHNNAVLFHLKTIAEERLIGFAAIHGIEWNNQSASLSIGIGEAEYRQRGYGSDALRLLMNYAFNELNLYRLGLDVIGNNALAIHTYEKAGFKHEGVLRCAVYRDGQRIDRLLMSILLPEWREMN